MSRKIRRNRRTARSIAAANYQARKRHYRTKSVIFTGRRRHQNTIVNEGCDITPYVVGFCIGALLF